MCVRRCSNGPKSGDFPANDKRIGSFRKYDEDYEELVAENSILMQKDLAQQLRVT